MFLVTAGFNPVISYSEDVKQTTEKMTDLHWRCQLCFLSSAVWMMWNDWQVCSATLQMSHSWRQLFIISLCIVYGMFWCFINWSSVVRTFPFRDLYLKYGLQTHFFVWTESLSEEQWECSRVEVHSNIEHSVMLLFLESATDFHSGVKSLWCLRESYAFYSTHSPMLVVSSLPDKLFWVGCKHGTRPLLVSLLETNNQLLLKCTACSFLFLSFICHLRFIFDKETWREGWECILLKNTYKKNNSYLTYMHTDFLK